MQVQDPKPFKNFTPPASPASSASSVSQPAPGHGRVLWVIGIILILIVVAGLLIYRFMAKDASVQPGSDESATIEDQVNQAFAENKPVPITQEDLKAAFTGKSSLSGASATSSGSASSATSSGSVGPKESDLKKAFSGN